MEFFFLSGWVMNKLVKRALSCFIIYACGSCYQFPLLSGFVFAVSRWKWIYSKGAVRNNDTWWFPTLRNNVFCGKLYFSLLPVKVWRIYMKHYLMITILKMRKKKREVKCLCCAGSYELPIDPNMFNLWQWMTFSQLFLPLWVIASLLFDDVL